jgi:hypothetical protein
MSDLPEYCGSLFLVFGFHGILLVDTESHTDAQAICTGFHHCDVTMIEHCMMPPDPSVWGVPRKEPDPSDHACGYDIDPDGEEQCEICDAPIPYMEPRAVAPSDPRLADIDLEADKARVMANADQLQARWRDLEAEDPQS